MWCVHFNWAVNTGLERQGIGQGQGTGAFDPSYTPLFSFLENF